MAEAKPGSRKCWNCLRELPADAKVCPVCERPVTEEPSADMQEFARQMLDQIPESARQELFAAMEKATSADEFVNSIFVGDCPKCGSNHVDCCEDDPEIENPLVGRCLECGHYWCTECGGSLKAKNPECPCWEEEDDDEDEDDEDEAP